MKDSSLRMGKKKCLACGRELSSNNFYLSKNELHKDGRVPWCKECIVSNSVDKDGALVEEKWQNVLRQIDKPYYLDVLQSSFDEVKRKFLFVEDVNARKKGADIISMYFKNINSLKQIASKTYADSESNEFIRKPGYDLKQFHVYDGVPKHVIKEYREDPKFKVTPEIIALFGDGFSKLEYRKMYEKYEKLKVNYSLQTNLHQEALVTYVRFKVREEMATARGDVEGAKKWFEAAQSAATNGKLTPRQLSESDLQGGINNFSDIFKAVEQAIDVIPILPRFKYRPNDALDFNIWCYINYARNLQNLPEVEYENVYKFYDKKKKEYIEQYGDPYGIFDEEPPKKLRENIKKFIRLPKDYDEGDS